MVCFHPAGKQPNDKELLTIRRMDGPKIVALSLSKRGFVNCISDSSVVECFMMLAYRCIRSIISVLHSPYSLLLLLQQIWPGQSVQTTGDCLIILLFGSAAMLTRMFNKAMTPMPHAALGTIDMSGVHGRCFRPWLCSTSSVGWLAYELCDCCELCELCDVLTISPVAAFVEEGV